MTKEKRKNTDGNKQYEARYQSRSREKCVGDRVFHGHECMSIHIGQKCDEKCGRHNELNLQQQIRLIL